MSNIHIYRFFVLALLSLSSNSVRAFIQQLKENVPTIEETGIVEAAEKNKFSITQTSESQKKAETRKEDTLSSSHHRDNRRSSKKDDKDLTDNNSEGDQEIKDLLKRRMTITSADFLKELPTYPRYLLNSGQKKKRGSCEQSVYLAPKDREIKFSLSDHVYKLKEKLCSWSFRGVEGCRVALSCDAINLSGKCETEFMEILDGAQGSLKICGGNFKSFVNVTASDHLRDIYIRYRANNGPHWETTGKKIFSCRASCSKSDQNLISLKKIKETRINPKCYCGTRPGQKRIVGGAINKNIVYPWLASLVDVNTRQTLCAGSVINSKYILTASHCINRHWMNYKNLQVVIHGEQFDPVPPYVEAPKTYSLEQLQRMDEGNKSIRFNVAEMNNHPHYIIKRHDFDVALIKLDGEIRFGTGSAQSHKNYPAISPICLPELGDYSTSYSGDTGHIAGWGMTTTQDGAWGPSKLNTATVKVMTPEHCVELYSHSYEKKMVRWRMMCAGYQEGGIDTCQGDSGSPLVMEEKNKVWRQIGITSWGEGCGEPGLPGVYFRTSEIVQWIHYVVNYNGKIGTKDENTATWCVTPS